VFHTAFLIPASDLHETIMDTLEFLALAAGISLTSGLIFRDSTPDSSDSRTPLTSTLPIRLFCWAAGLMLLLFISSWYLESHCIFYRDTHLSTRLR
jgi:hypothetical protein